MDKELDREEWLSLEEGEAEELTFKRIMGEYFRRKAAMRAADEATE